MDAYRFRTRQEFENDYGDDWREELNYHFYTEMDSFCGSKFTYEENLQVWEVMQEKKEEGYRENLDDIDLEMRGFAISGDMIKQEGTFTPIVSTKYRFRTEAEFKKELGEDWRNGLPDYFDTTMDHLLGRVLSIEENLLVKRCMDESHDYFLIEGGEFYPVMLVETTSGVVSITEPTVALKRDLFKKRKNIRVCQDN